MVETITPLPQADKAILRALQSNGRATNIELSRAANISESSCVRRVRQLEESGVITQYTAVVNPAALGFTMTVFVSISLKDQSQESLRKFEASVAKIPQVLECHLMTGTYDYIVKLAAKDNQDLEQLHSNQLTRLPGVARVVSSLAMRPIIERYGPSVV
jgi:Lrp/AsnC family transcriptional regulator, leucine-responsive regulatory protein